VTFVVEEWHWSRLSSEKLACIIPPLPQTHEACDSPDQAASYHILGTEILSLTLTQLVAGHGMKAVLFYRKKKQASVI
jgi:hypothetical protein